MVQEIEVKLEAPPGTVSALAREPWLRRLAVSPLKKERLVSVYYDTDRFDLRDKGIAFRLRHADGKIFQSVKRGAVLSRQEWEWEIDGGKPDFGKARQDGSPLKSLPVKKRDLKPVFETDVKRRVLPVRYRDSEIEIAFDRGEVKTGRRHVPISEIELELKGGKAAGLIELAGRIAAKAHASYGALPKAARGYALKKGGPDQPVWADTLYLDPGLDAEGCFKTVALSCLSHFAANEKAVLAGEAEGVHQMRVGLRRLRTALSLFKALLRGGELENIKTELKWLTEELGPARDMDVLIQEGLKPLEASRPREDTVPALEGEVEARRDKGFARAKRALETPRYRKLVLDTALWIAGGRWTRVKDELMAARRKGKARAFAAAELSRRFKKILKGQKKLARLDDLKRHKLRIKIKKLRYALDFFASLFGRPKARRKFEEALKNLQTVLGELNDIRVHGGLAHEFAHPRGRGRSQPQKAFAMGLFRGAEKGKKERLIGEAVKHGKKLARLSPPWM